MSKEISLEEKYDIYTNILKEFKNKEKFRSFLFKFFTFAWIFGSIICFLLIFILDIKKIVMIILTIVYFNIGALFALLSSTALNILNEKLLERELDLLDGIFVYKPALYKKNSNNHYIIFQAFVHSAIFISYRFDVEQFKNIKNIGILNNDYFFLNKNYLTHRVAFENELFDFYYEDLEVILGLKEPEKPEEEPLKKEIREEIVEEDMKEEVVEVEEKMVDEIEEKIDDSKDKEEPLDALEED